MDVHGFFWGGLPNLILTQLLAHFPLPHRLGSIWFDGPSLRSMAGPHFSDVWTFALGADERDLEAGHAPAMAGRQFFRCYCWLWVAKEGRDRKMHQFGDVSHSWSTG